MKTLTETSRATGLSIGRLRVLAAGGRIPLVDKKIPGAYVRALEAERLEYISLREYAVLHNGEKFDGKSRKDCLALLDALEEQDWFEVLPVLPAGLLCGAAKDIMFFPRGNIPLLDLGLCDFFQLYGLSEKEKIELYLSRVGSRPEFVALIQNFLVEEAKGHLAPSHTALVRLMTQAPDIILLEDRDVRELFRKPMGMKTRKLLARFLNEAREKTGAGYSLIRLPKKKPRPLPAYTDDQYISLARCVFNPRYIQDHRMIEKAVECPLYAEMWLYVAIFYVCGWRGGDVCRGWAYPALSEKAVYFPGLHLETLREDLLNDSIPQEVYVKVCEYAVATVEASMILPGKNARLGPAPLALLIAPEMYTFYGLLSLIGEYHHMQNPKNGHLDERRSFYYQNRIRLAELFGKEFTDILQDENLQTRRLNKDYLQGVEDAARRSGCGAVRASTVASYARNHTSLDTVRAYLCDHNLTGEHAGMVVYALMERGVLAFGSYQALLAAYPDSFGRLPLKEQTKIIQKLDMSPMQLECEASLALAARDLSEGFVKASGAGQDRAGKILQMLFEISQGRGNAKDECGYCAIRALGYACPHPSYESCIASGCEHLILSKYGVRPLLEVLKAFQEKELAGDKKAGAVLRKILLPRYYGLINAFVKQLKPEEGQKEEYENWQELCRLIKRMTVEELE